MPASNPASPLAAYPRSTIVDVRVKSVTSLGPDVALVRFDTLRRDAGGQPLPPRAWVTVIRYRYSGEPMTVEDRFVNPLGFQVVRYRRSAEALQPPEPITVPISGRAAPTVQRYPASVGPAWPGRLSAANIPYGSPLQSRRVP